MCKNMRTLWEKLNRFVAWLDGLPLWSLGILLMAAVFAPYFLLKEGSVFPIHDQLDETILCYVLNARYLGTGAEIFPELLGGVNVSGMQPSAVLFILLYRIFPAFAAFLIQYGIVFAAGFFGMYFCVREITGSSILACVAAGCFSMLPIQPVYGLSIMGVPLLLYSFLCLYRKKHVFLSFLLVSFFGLTTHLVLIGYVALGFWALALFGLAVKHKPMKLPVLGFVCLLAIYLTVNYRLFLELLLGKSSYVSHREEQVSGAAPFWNTVWDMFLNSGQHAASLHKFLIIPILVMLAAGAFLYRRMGKKSRQQYIAAAAGLALLVGIAFFCGICGAAPIVNFRNGCNGFLRYFQPDRVYWLYPAGWYLEFALCASFLWQEIKGAEILKSLVLLAVLLPVLQEIKVNSYFYMNVNQINNGSGITGYISWESWYAEDLMAEIEQAIGRDMSTFRVAHLGMSPAPALMHGFYTADGYSNNYPLEYKHSFRRVIERELEKSPETAVYFDTWGSRCYLFNGESGTAYMIGKDRHFVYRNLELNMEALKSLGCEYLFSCGEILNADEMSLELMGYFETEESYWGVWLYKIA